MQCAACSTRTMVRRVGAAGIYFECPCGSTVAGTAESRVIASGGHSSSAADNSEMYAAIVTNAPHSRTVLRVAQQCKKCGLPYMFQVRVGPEETIIRNCKCGNQVSVN